MLSKKVLIDKLGIEYKPMIDKISIADFTKCIAQYAGIEIQYLKDDIIEEYLTKWAINKKHLFDLFGDIRVDMPITYTDEDRDYRSKLIDSVKNYPVYYPWIEMFNRQVKNKIDANAIGYSDLNTLKEIFPNYKIDGVSITHFFKSKLNAPDELVTSIGRVFENAEVNGTYTISIDPVDIMLSSENPYNWTSCYRLEHFSESHADGCLAGVLDGSTAISYIWTNEGKFDLYGYEFKKIRYKKVRITLAINHTHNAVHFNSVYPWKSDATDDFKKLIRSKVESFICERTGKENLWKKYDYDSKVSLNPYRICSEYGYGEYDSSYVYIIKNEPEWAAFEIYNAQITCPCGCGQTYIGSDSGDYLCYNGDGHTNDNWFEEEDDEYYCEETGEYENCDGDCHNCPTYNRYHMVCELDTEQNCERRNYWEVEDEGDADFYEDNIVKCNPEHCMQCPLYKIHHPEEFEEEVINAIEEQPIPVSISLAVDPNTVTWGVNNVSWITNSTDNIKKDLIFYKILSGEDFTLDEFKMVLNKQYDDPVLPNMVIYELSNSDNDRHISVSIPKAAIDNEDFINIIKAQIHN